MSRRLMFAGVLLALPGTAYAAGQQSADPVPNQAQDQALTSDSSSGDIIVTALKRSESLQRVPAALTALSSVTLETRQLSTVSDIATLVPNLNFSIQGGATLIGIRGVAPDGALPSTDPSVAQHIDGVYQPRVGSMDLALADLNSVEVLRGPQGTLYGRNATAGVINFILKKPTDDFEAGASALYGNYDRVQLKAFASGPLSDAVSVRLSGLFDKHDGYGHNLLTGNRYDSQNTKGIRGAIRVKPTSSLTIDLSAYYSRDTGATSQPTALTVINGARLAQFYPFPVTTEPRNVYSTRDPVRRNEQSGVTGTITADLAPNVTFKSLTGYVNNKLYQTSDTVPAAIDYSYIVYKTKTNFFSQEFNLTSNLFDRVDVILGLYYAHDHYYQYGDNEYPLGLVPAASNKPASFLFLADQLAKTKAAFGDVTFHVTDTLRLNGGLRYNKDTKSITQTVGVAPAPACNPQPDDLGYSSTTGKIGAQYDVASRVMIYAQYQTGFKAGGFNTSACNDPFDPEKVRSYEGGIKASTAGGVLTANLAIFHSQLSGLQVSTTVPINGQPANRIENAASALIRGIEGEFTIRPTNQLRANLNVAYLDAHYQNFASVNSAAIVPANRVLLDLRGYTAMKAPKFTLNAGLEYDIPVGDYTVTPRGEVFRSSKIYYDPYHNAELEQSGFTIVNAYLNIVPPGGRYRVSAYGKNLTNKAYVIGGSLSTLGIARGDYNPPRTYGVQVSVRY